DYESVDAKSPPSSDHAFRRSESPLGLSVGFNRELDVKSRAIALIFYYLLVAWVRRFVLPEPIRVPNLLRFSPTLVGRKEVMEELFHPAYDGDVKSLSAFSLSSLLSVCAMGLLWDSTTPSWENDYKLFRYWARALFWTEFPKGPTTIADMESLLLLFALSGPSPDIPAEQSYELLAWGIKMGLRTFLPVYTCLFALNYEQIVILNLSTYLLLRLFVVDGSSGTNRLSPLHFADCNILELELGATANISQRFLPEYHAQLTLLIQDMLAHFMESGLSPSYAAVIRMEAKFQQLDVNTIDSPTPTVTDKMANAPESPSEERRQAILAYKRGYKSFLALNLHKTYFSYSIMRPKEDPLHGRLGKSTHAM
ncbi:10530_t:CDS:2, partial [Acaulospora colombiana]